MEIVKKKWWVAPLAALALVSMPACSDDDDDDIINIPEQYVSALQKMYPSASKVSWEQEGAYKVAEFNYNGYSTDVWFNNQVEWVMTETDYNRNLNALPAAVADAFNQSQYASYLIDDIDGYERLDATFYVIEVEMPGLEDQDIYINSNGEIIRVVADYGMEVTPTTPI